MLVNVPNQLEILSGSCLQFDVPSHRVPSASTVDGPSTSGIIEPPRIDPTLVSFDQVHLGYVLSMDMDQGSMGNIRIIH